LFLSGAGRFCTIGLLLNYFALQMRELALALVEWRHRRGCQM